MHILLIVFFILGYAAIIFEKFLHINKAAVALFMGAGCWVLFFAADSHQVSLAEVNAHIADVAQIIFFLLAVMTIVELIDSHQGFKGITDLLHTPSKRKLMWLLLGITFVMSPIIDNLTTMIIMVPLLRKLVANQRDRWLMGSILIITINASGSWTPIGDLTTTMLWIDEKITTWGVIRGLFLPSLVCVVVAGLISMFFIHGKKEEKGNGNAVAEPKSKMILWLGIGALIAIPFWKAVFDIPPFMGALLGLGLLWLITDLVHHRHGEKRWHLRVPHILQKIDFSTPLFFLGILLAVEALGVAGILKEFATRLDTVVRSQYEIAIVIGLISTVIDNVPLVAAVIEMYSGQYPADAPLWLLTAFTAGTGGSILIIGSAAGIAFMGLEKVDFFWYLKRVSWIALISYFAGIATYSLI